MAGAARRGRGGALLPGLGAPGAGVPRASAAAGRGGAGVRAVRGAGARAVAAAGARVAAAAAGVPAKALLFDCDGVLLESEALHLRAYNASFREFELVDPEGAPVEWSVEYYDKLQNTVGGGKAKMRWHFERAGWPASTRGPAPGAAADGGESAEQTTLIDALQDFKVEAYKGFISGGDVVPRPRVLELMQEAREAGLKVAVCSASAKPAVIHVLSNLLGEEQFAALDCFLAGDDVENKKPHPEIYNVAAKRLGLSKEECVVIEDSGVGCSAAMAAGMRCVITYTDSTAGEPFEGAERILADLASPAGFTAADALAGPPAAVVDDRVTANV